ncbi:hypothetical protein AVO45_12930 [Ruegeria marisrubri]|uniref:HTH cro/C1-type domain-containing protein n=1 Tax=Ruegeria marisrubri TaxID=1685379 RepID=A0A0X3TKC7_9RHOB|nr:helix-turn-helix transcriptional regulator [Ruegeria marisrubri]KUJ76213.1 hypothetical protein AVO45_12930 [Ruegeria marisrubri]
MIRSDFSKEPADPTEETIDNSSPNNRCTPVEVREKAGLSVSEMAELIGMSESGYRMWEKGMRQPGGPAFKLLALLDAQPRDMVARLQAQI